MKPMIALAAAVTITALTAISPAAAQNKDPACMEKCSRQYSKGPSVTTMSALSCVSRRTNGVTPSAS